MFLLKSDISLKDEFLGKLNFFKDTQSKIKISDVENLVSILFGQKPVKIDFINSGTFNLIYLFSINDKNEYILKVPLKIKNFEFSNFSKQILVHDILCNSHILVPKILFSNKSYQDPFIIMDFISGSTLNTYSEHSMSYDLVLRKLTSSLKKVHQIEVSGYGLLSQSNQSLKGQFLSWNEYLLTELDRHLHLCIKNQYFNKSDLDFITQAFTVLEQNFAIPNARLLHGDLGPKNAITRPDGNLFLIDWEDCLGGDPIFDIAMWGSFLMNTNKLNVFLDAYYDDVKIPNDFYMRYYLYSLRIVIAKTIHRYRFQVYKNDKIAPRERLLPIIQKLKEILQ
jgi:fructosamine-3-kinase